MGTLWGCMNRQKLDCRSRGSLLRKVNCLYHLHSRTCVMRSDGRGSPRLENGHRVMRQPDTHHLLIVLSAAAVDPDLVNYRGEVSWFSE